jgi:beta-N-acetylhexosaminidase
MQTENLNPTFKTMPLNTSEGIKLQNSKEALSPTQQQWVDTTLATLTLREKIGQTAQERFSGFPGDKAETMQRYFEDNPLGSLFCGGEIILGAGATADVIRNGLALCQQASKVPLLIAGDLECGAGAAISGLTVFPHMMALGATNDEKLAYEYGKCTAQEGRAAGFTWTFAPVVDLLQNWLNPVVSNRCLGDRPEHVAPLAKAVIRGMQEHGLSACAKHFPGDGIDFRDQHLVTSVNSLTEEDWWKNHGRVFQEVIAQGVYSIMIGHIALPWLEPLTAGQRRVRPATVSHKIITELLREEMGFQGVIVSDALIMAGFTGWGAYEQRIVEAFNAGNDVMLWPGPDYSPVMERAVNEGRVTVERLDESVRRVLTLKARVGLCDLQESSRDPHALDLSGSHLAPELDQKVRAVAQDVAAKSVTLVRNSAHLLPLDPARVKRVLLHKAVSPVPAHKDSLDNLVARLRARNLDLTILENGNCLDIWKREQSGERWDAYIVAFSLQIHQMKNTVRPVGPMGEVIWTLQTVETVQPIVVSLGTPFLLNEMPFLDTLVNCYSSSDGSVEALVCALFGEAPFFNFSPVEVGGAWAPTSPRSIVPMPKSQIPKMIDNGLPQFYSSERKCY